MYTDDYNNEEVVEEEKKTNNSFKLLKIIGIIILVIIILALLYFIFRKNFTSSSQEDIYVLKVYPENIVVSKGKNEVISYEVRKNGIILNDAAVRFTVVDDTVATIDNTTVTGVKYGKTMVTATYISPDGKSFQESNSLTVADGNPNVSINSVSFPEGDLQMPFNGTYDLKLGINPPNGYVENKVITSSNENVVVVDNNGTITAISEGEATIFIDINNGAFTKDIKVYVSRNNEISKLVVSPTSIIISNSISKIKVDDTFVLKYTIVPSNASIDNIEWSSSNNDVLSIDYRGKITAHKEGMATIKVQTFNNISDSINVEVEKKNVLVESIDLSFGELNMIVGQTQMLVPTISPQDATDKILSYEISDPTVAIITPSADTSTVTITPISMGVAVLTIKSNSSNVVKTVNITITNATTEPENSGSSGSCGSCSKANCGAGKYCSCGVCKSCPAGNYCYNNKKTPCAAGKGSISNSSSYQDCSDCAKGYYSTGDGKGCVACPSGTTTKGTGSTSKDDCTVTASPTITPKPTASNGCYLTQYMSGGVCHDCEAGYKCNGKTRTKCPEGTISIKNATTCTTCSTGKSNDARTQCVR